MKVYNEEKTEILSTYDLEKGYLRADKIIKEILPAQEEIEEQGHYEIVREYENGGKDVEWVVDVAGQKARPETPVYEDVQVYVPFTEEEFVEHLRKKREIECFEVLTKYSRFWFDNLSAEQHEELKVWYEEWLDVTETKTIPEKPTWLK